MKDISLLAWLSQLGFSVAFPLAAFILLGVWLRDSCGWGDWVFWAGLVLGLYCAIDGLRACLKTLSRLAKRDKKGPPPVAFNDHE